MTQIRITHEDDRYKRYRFVPYRYCINPKCRAADYRLCPSCRVAGLGGGLVVLLGVFVLKWTSVW